VSEFKAGDRVRWNQAPSIREWTVVGPSPKGDKRALTIWSQEDRNYYEAFPDQLEVVPDTVTVRLTYGDAEVVVEVPKAEVDGCRFYVEDPAAATTDRRRVSARVATGFAKLLREVRS